MSGSKTSFWRRVLRAVLGAAIAIPLLLPPAIVPAAAAGGDRTLYLYYTHTKQTAKITFRRNGRYDQKGLADLNWFLRDWRREQPTRMDPGLFDLVWEVYQASGATGPIHVVSAFRSNETNEMLRARSSAVAKNSRHTQGMAMDFFIPGVSLPKLREIAMRRQVGGVGYYPTSGSPFVHVDTGSVRAWPRMTRAQLERVFPDGKTMHLPTDGKPLSQRGYQLAKAEWSKCHSVPCNRNGIFSADIRVASGGDADKSGPRKSILDAFFGNEDDEGAEETAITVASTKGPAERAVSSVPVSAPVPFTRAGTPALLVADAPTPAIRPRALISGAPQPLGERPQTLMVASIDNSGPAPAPRALISGPEGKPNSAMSAYAPAADPEPEAQHAIQMLIERSGRSRTLEATAPATDNIETASLGDPNALDALGLLIESTWTAVSGAGDPARHEDGEEDLMTGEIVRGEFVAPDLDHVTEIFADPEPLTSERYAVLFDRDQGTLDPQTELGGFAGRAVFGSAGGWGLQTTRFAPADPLLVAAR